VGVAKFGYSVRNPVNILAIGHTVDYHSVLHYRGSNTCSCHYINAGSESCQRSFAKYGTK
jgi:hypothetical protein